MKIMITGATGLFGADIARVCKEKGHIVLTPLGRQELDVSDGAAVDRYVAENQPEVIIHSAGFRMVDDAEDNAPMTFMINCLGSKNIALAAEKYGVKLVHISSDSVFDGELHRPYTEYDKTNPVNIYGQSKWMAEQEVKTYCKNHFIIRVPLLFGALGHKASNYIFMMRDKIEAGEVLEYTTDQLCSPTYTYDAAEAICEIMESGFYGTYHLANEGVASRYDFYKTCAELLGLDTSGMIPVLQQAKKARRSKTTVFESVCYEKTFGKKMRNWKEAIAVCIAEMQQRND